MLKRKRAAGICRHTRLQMAAAIGKMNALVRSNPSSTHEVVLEGAAAKRKDGRTTLCCFCMIERTCFADERSVLMMLAMAYRV